MRPIADYHTHTRYSHGTGTVRQNVRAAIEKGLSEVAITDHGPAMLFIGVDEPRWSLLIDEARRVGREIRGGVGRDDDPAGSRRDGIRVLVGIEANVVGLDGTLDIPKRIARELDIVLAGIHLQIRPKTLDDGLRLVWRNMTTARWSGSAARRARIDNTKALVEAVYRNRIDIITHPGLKVNIDTRELARACAKRGTALEINASHRRSDPEYVRVAAREGAMFAICSDAHSPDDVGRFDWAVHVAEKAGLQASQVINAARES